MITVVLRCGDTPVPLALTSLPVLEAAAVPAEFGELLPLLDAQAQPRLAVVGRDAALAAVLTWMMRTERLHYEVGFVPTGRSQAARAWHTGTGTAAAKRLLHGTAKPVPLIRDDTGTVLAGYAKIAGAGDGPLEGEAYADETRLFSGTVRALHVVPALTQPGVAAYADRGPLRRARWHEGRAVQLGTPGAVIARDGVRGERTVARASFYRHHEPWLLVR